MRRDGCEPGGRGRFRPPASRIGAYFRWRLRRRIFWWFGLTIAATFAVAAGTMHLLGQGGAAWRNEITRARALLAHSFERVWDRPDEREAVARMIARDLDVEVVVKDAASRTLVATGRCEKPWVTTPIAAEGAIVGRVDLCPSGARPRAGPRNVLAFGVAAVVLWAISGRVARRLARPYDQLATMARALGEGRFGTRVRVPSRAHGEAWLIAEVLNDMAARIEKQLEDSRELLAGVSHEIRTPLSRIRILVELARDGGDVGKTLDEIDREVVEIDALVSELLAKSRLDFAALKPTDLDPVDLVTRALDRAGVDTSRLVIEGEPRSFRGDPTLLARALANLLDNARRHGGGVERLRVARHGERVRFEVEDLGPGFAPGEESKVFESFYSVDRGEGEQGSLGLGLALVRRIAEAHGGRAYARNVDGGGACVGIELPTRSQ